MWHRELDCNSGCNWGDWPGNDANTGRTQFPVKDLVCLADPKEAGTKVKFKGEEITVRGANEEAFKNVDVALLQ